MKSDEPMTLEEAGALLRRFQLNEWELDRRMSKKARREQWRIVREFLIRLCRRGVTNEEIDHVLNSMN